MARQILNPECAAILNRKRRELILGLELAMRKSGIPQEKLCTKAGISVGQSSKAKHSGRITLETLILLADALDMEVIVQKRRRSI